MWDLNPRPSRFKRDALFYPAELMCRYKMHANSRRVSCFQCIPRRQRLYPFKWNGTTTADRHGTTPFSMVRNAFKLCKTDGIAR